jgi:hypothetical protein
LAGALVAAVGLSGLLGQGMRAQEQQASPPKRPAASAADERPETVATAAIERTRKMVRMLDDIYKGAIVTITQHYVNDREMIPAGTAFKQLFAAIEQKGWHRVRLVDATGEPYNDENVAQDDFEKAAIRQLVEGKPWVELIDGSSTPPKMRVATPIPVVMDKCVMCHAQYASVPEGRAIGALIYTVPVE